MSNLFLINRSTLIVAIPLAMLAVLVYLMKSTLAIGNETLSLAITVDLLITVPLIYYFLIRKSEIPKTTIVPMIILGVVLGSIFLPNENQTYLNYFKTWILPLLEIGILVYVILNVRRATRALKLKTGAQRDLFTFLREACGEILPGRLAVVFATEFAVLYYGFISWRGRKLNSREFSYHRNSGVVAIFSTIIFLVIAETFVFHLLLQRWSIVAAWVLTILSIYTAIQLLGITKSISRRPIAIDDGKLYLRYGILKEAIIPFSDIEAILQSTAALDKQERIKNLFPFEGIQDPNVVIRLSREHTLVGLYGFKQEFTTLGLFVDEPNHFVTMMRSELEKRQWNESH